MPFIDPSEDFHHYAGSEAFIGDLPLADSTSKRYLKFRLHTVILKPDGDSPGSSPWVYIPVEDLEQFSAQMAATAESAKRLVDGETFQSLGDNIGVMNTTGKFD